MMAAFLQDISTLCQQRSVHHQYGHSRLAIDGLLGRERGIRSVKYVGVAYDN